MTLGLTEGLALLQGTCGRAIWHGPETGHNNKTTCRGVRGSFNYQKSVCRRSQAQRRDSASLASLARSRPGRRLDESME